MKYIDLSKLPTSPYSAITNVVALDSNGDIIKAENINIENELTDYPTKEEVNETLENYVTKDDIPTPQATGTEVTADAKKYVYNGTGTTSIISKIEHQGRGTNSYQLRYNKWGSNTTYLLNFQMATSTAAGMMSADMYNKLMNLNSGDTATKVVWGESSNINSYTTAGVYDITGERRNANDNLPIMNSNPGHTIAARLYVLDSSISGNGANDDKCLTQVLMLSNRVGGDGNLYVRTGRGSSISNISWEQWGTLQQNINVGTITSYNNLIDNGIYSGVYTNGSTKFDTFVMVVINNYAVAGQVGAERTISQFLYVTHIDGSVEFLKRVKIGDVWIGDFSNIAVPQITLQNYTSLIPLPSVVYEYQIKGTTAESIKNKMTNDNTIWHWINKATAQTGSGTPAYIRLSRGANGSIIFCEGPYGWFRKKYNWETFEMLGDLPQITSLT